MRVDGYINLFLINALPVSPMGGGGGSLNRRDPRYSLVYGVVAQASPKGYAGPVNIPKPGLRPAKLEERRRRVFTQHPYEKKCFLSSFKICYNESK